MGVLDEGLQRSKKCIFPPNGSLFLEPLAAFLRPKKGFCEEILMWVSLLGNWGYGSFSKIRMRASKSSKKGGGHREIGVSNVWLKWKLTWVPEGEEQVAVYSKNGEVTLAIDAKRRGGQRGGHVERRQLLLRNGELGFARRDSSESRVTSANASSSWVPVTNRMGFRFVDHL